MSSTNRGSKRHKDDFYETPTWLTEAIIPYIRPFLPATPRILEPAYGDGAITRILEAEFPQAHIVSGDINGGGSLGKNNFLTDPIGLDFDLILSNPPFLLAQEFITTALTYRKCESSLVVMLSRLNFLGSKKRASWWRDNPAHIYVTPKRPSFRADGKTDSIEYAWFVWRDGKTSVTILPTEKF